MALNITRRICPAAAMVLAAISAHAGGIPTLGPGEEAWLSGTVQKVDLKSRTCTLAVESIRRLDGTESKPTGAATQTVVIPQTVRISHLNSPHRWLRLQELAVGSPVSLTVFGPSEPKSPWQGRSLLINRADPMVPAYSAPVPSGINAVEPDRVTQEQLVVPMVFPMSGSVKWSDTFLAARGGGTRRHRGQDIFAPKMTPLVACFDGVVTVRTNQGNAGHVLTLKGDNGWTAQYYHLNNDTPGTDDNKAPLDYTFAPGIVNGARVYAGQIVGYNGDSGNAESTSPHCHFELWYTALNACFNPQASLSASIKLAEPLLYVPFPEISAGDQMVRYDGHVRAVDPTQNLLVVDLLTERLGNGALTFKSKPETRIIRAPENPRFLLLDTGDVVSLADIPANSQVAVFAEAKTTNDAHNLARAWVLPGAPPAPAQRPVATNPAPQKSVAKGPVKSSITFTSETFVLSKSYARRSNTAHADQIAATINQSREAKGLQPLEVSNLLCDAALAHTITMRDGDFLDELDAKAGLTAADKARQKGYPRHVRSVVLSSRNLDRAAAELLQRAPETLTDPNLKSIGVGYAHLEFDPGQTNVRHYYTILLGS